MIRAVLFKTLLMILLCLGMAVPLLAQSAPLQSGSYRCFISNSAPSAPAVNPRDPDWRKSQGLRPLEPGERAVAPIPTPMIMITPAFFGNIVIDGKGNYRMTGNGKTGKYGFNAAVGVPTFTGDLAIMKVRGYDSSVGRFFLVYDSLAFQCGRQGASISPSPTRLPAPAAAVKRPSLPATAALLTGRFKGAYVCNDDNVSLQLDTKASDSGVIVAVFQFFGDSEASSGIFSLHGKWTKDGFSLEPHEWVRQPSRTYKMVGLDGGVTNRGLSGRVLLVPQCTAFDVARVTVATK